VDQVTVCVQKLAFVKQVSPDEAEQRTNVKEDGSVKLLVDNVRRQDLVVQGLGRAHGHGHCDVKVLCEE
jgi:hypothetical protein